ncbi:LOW QUALITY PROTEIN: hypothetical protein Cgig2_030297 [Carnegiea gigantea]|uniref:Uncharacterized protein n=1 Tax=Carnegiea gigantea TaxID=171969 RepID=A0A9Q1JQQ0_9CARY|nr:LOW QUALITY PROTEIN: hypothetical protein Cgig2_030297 [Carnegiea gigantea]
MRALRPSMPTVYVLKRSLGWSNRRMPNLIQFWVKAYVIRPLKQTSVYAPFLATQVGILYACDEANLYYGVDKSINVQVDIDIHKLLRERIGHTLKGYEKIEIMWMSQAHNMLSGLEMRRLIETVLSKRRRKFTGIHFLHRIDVSITWTNRDLLWHFKAVYIWLEPQNKLLTYELLRDLARQPSLP